MLLYIILPSMIIKFELNKMLVILNLLGEAKQIFHGWSICFYFKRM